MLVALKLAHAPIPLGQPTGTGMAPRFWAPLQASFAGGVPPLQEGHDETGQGTQEMVASNPVPVIVRSEVNSIVRQPVVAVRTPGKVDPVNVPSNGDAELGPL